MGLMPPHDRVYLHFRDLEGLRCESELASNLGFGAKHAIHPEQITAIRESFRPTKSQIIWAKKAIEAFEQSEVRGVAAIRVKGQFVDYPIAARARRIIARVESAQVGDDS